MEKKYSLTEIMKFYLSLPDGVYEETAKFLLHLSAVEKSGLLEEQLQEDPNEDRGSMMDQYPEEFDK